MLMHAVAQLASMLNFVLTHFSKQQHMKSSCCFFFQLEAFSFFDIQYVSANGNLNRLAQLQISYQHKCECFLIMLWFSSQAELLTGMSVTSVEDASQVGLELLNKGCGSVIVTLGPQGCVVCQPTNAAPKHIPTTTVTAADTTVRLQLLQLQIFVVQRQYISFIESIKSVVFDKTAVWQIYKLGYVLDSSSRKSEHCKHLILLFMEKTVI